MHLVEERLPIGLVDVANVFQILLGVPCLSSSCVLFICLEDFDDLLGEFLLLLNDEVVDLLRG
jgi:hypothetical protein